MTRTPSWILLSTVSALLLASASLAQGSNTCSTATPIAGAGTFPFSNVGATTDGPGTCSPMSADADGGLVEAPFVAVPDEERAHEAPPRAPTIADDREGNR